MRDLYDAPSRPDTTSVEGGVKVLLGSESGDFATWLRSRLETEGCLVETAETGAAVVEMARGGHHVIFVELESESVDGLAVLRELKSPLVAVQCPIVLIKGDEEPAHIVQRGLDLGAAGYIVKRRPPGSISMQAILDAFGITTARPGSKRSPVLQMQRARSEACPFSARNVPRMLGLHADQRAGSRRRWAGTCVVQPPARGRGGGLAALPAMRDRRPGRPRKVRARPDLLRLYPK